MTSVGQASYRRSMLPLRRPRRRAEAGDARPRADRGRRWRCCPRSLTFLVLTDLTPIAPTHEVVVTLLVDQRRHRAAAARRHRPGAVADRAGAAARARRRAAACAHRRPVLGHRRGAGHPGRGRRQHHARSRSRPLVLHAHPRGDREFAHRRAGLCARARRDDPRRHRRDGVRRRARQAAVRSGPRAIPPVLSLPGDRARPAGAP